MFPLNEECGYYDLRDDVHKHSCGVRLVRERQHELIGSRKRGFELLMKSETIQLESF